MIFFKPITLVLLINLLALGRGISLYAQTYPLRGQVTDLANGLPLPKAAVIAQNSNSSAISDEDGYFSIDIGPVDTLLISYLGYLPKKVPVQNSKSFVNVRMQSDNLMLENVVVEAYQSNKKLNDTPGSISVLTPREMERDDNVHVVPAINRVPGVLMQSGALNTNRLTIRGIGARSLFATTKIRAYLNEIPLTTGDGETTIEDIDLDLIRRVEVIKGPSSSIYGAGLGGTVLMEVSPMSQDVTRAGTGLITGSFGLIKSNTSVELSRQNLQLGLGYNYLHSDGYRDNNQYDRHSVTTAGAVTRENTRISFFGSYIDLLGFIPSAIDSATFAENPQAAAPSWQEVEGFEDYNKGLFGVSVNQRIDPDLTLDVSVFHRFRESYELRPFGILTENTSAVGTRNVLSYRTNNEFITRIIGGVEYFTDWYKWKTLEQVDGEPGATQSDNKETRQYLNAFVQMDLEILDNLHSSLGLNLNTTTYQLEDRFFGDTIDQTGSYRFDPVLSPRFTLRYDITENRNIYGVISHGFSPPSLSETLTPEGLINTDIQPETGYNFELGYKGDLLKNIHIQAAIYSMQIRNLIVARRVDRDQYVGLNAGKTNHNGIEISAHQNITMAGGSITPFVRYTYADYRFKDFVDGEEDHSGNELTGVPDHLFNGGVDFAHSTGIYGNVNYHYVGTMPMRDDNSIYNDPYGVTNFKAGWRRSWRKFDVNVFGGIKNLFDKKYAGMIMINASAFGGGAPRYYYPGSPINYYAGFEVHYKIEPGS